MDEKKNYAQVVSPSLRRLGAFSVDFALLYVLGRILLWALKDFFLFIGYWGNLLGALILLAYFGIQNSRIGKGRTLGKRLFYIKVLGKDGGYISLKRSLVRTAILITPLLISFPWIPYHVSGKLLFSLLLNLYFFSGIVIPYLYLFNTKSRQSLHDLFTGTMVALGEGELKGLLIPALHKGHRTFFTLLILIQLILSAVMWNQEDPDLEPLYRDLLKVEDIVYLDMEIQEERAPEELSHSSMAPLFERRGLHLYLYYTRELTPYDSDPQVRGMISEHQENLQGIWDFHIYNVNLTTLGYVSKYESFNGDSIERFPRILF